MSEFSTDVLKWTAESDKEIIVHSGGTSSGKTYSILEYLTSVAILCKNKVITVVGQDKPNLRVGAYRQQQEIIYNSPYSSFYLSNLAQHNRSHMAFLFKSNSLIEYNSYDNPQDAKSGKRDFLFINEANGVSYEIFDDLQVRTNHKTIIDFNPTREFWAHKKLKNRDNVDWFNSTWQNNPFIDDSIRDKILSYKPTPENIANGTADNYRWEVYGLGKTGRLEGSVYTNWERGKFPNDYKWRVYGLDFGFTNDPTALIEVKYLHGHLYVKEHVYKTNLTNQDISEIMQKKGISRNELIIADSAEPKSIEELTRLGWNIRGANKGRDSVVQGIDVVKRFKLIVEGENIAKELNSYIWDKSRDGEFLNKPVDSFNHALDALRYAVTNRYHRIYTNEGALTSALV